MKKPKTLSDALSSVGLSMSRDRLILFGSRAQGKAGPDSDWDIMVVGASRKLRSNYDVQILQKSLRQWSSNEFYQTELAACIAVYGLPLSYELPKRSRLNYVAIREAAAARARRLWHIPELVRDKDRKLTPGMLLGLRMKAATSALLASEYYSIHRACPARSVLIEHWDSLALYGQRNALESVGIFGEPPDSIDLAELPHGADHVSQDT